MTDKLFKQLSKKLNTPKKVQAFLRNYSYNFENNGETLRSAKLSLKSKEAHCLEAALIAAALLEHHGYPPLVMSLESQDDLDHVVYVFKENNRWGAIGRSRMEGLHGREPIFKSLKDLAMSYYDCFIDATGRVEAFGLANLDDSGAPWRNSLRNVWKVENFLIDLKHTKLKVSMKRYHKWFDYFKKTGQSGVPQKYWW